MTLLELIDLVNLDPKIKDSGNTKFPLLLKVNRLNAAYLYLCNKIADIDTWWRIGDVTMTASSDGVALPKDFLRVKDIRKSNTPIYLIEPRTRHNYNLWPAIVESSWYAYLKGGKIYFGNGVSGIVEFGYIRRPAKLHRGEVKEATSTTVTLADEAVMGTVETSDDYYNHATISILSGTGAGQEREITDYVGSTKVATVGEWTDGIPDSSSVYEIKCELPETQGFDDILIELTIAKILKKKIPPDSKEDLVEALAHLGLMNYQNSV